MTTQIQNLLHSSNIPFIESGRDYLIRCLNPEHEDRHPSMRIDRETGTFHCLSCHYKGNILSYFGKRVDYLDTKRNKLMRLIEDKLRESAGLELPEGYTLLSLNKYRGISKKTYDAFGAFTHNDYEDRLMFPITNSAGKIVCFQGRHMSDGTPKYKFYPSHAKVPMFPMADPIDNTVVLVEGLFDMLNLHDKGMTNVICVFGVNGLSEEKISLLKLKGILNVIILFDNDDAGKAGALKAKTLLESNDLSCRIVTPTSKDPGDMTQEQVDKLKEYIYDRDEDQSSSN